MKILNNITIKNLILNRKRTIVTIIGIILSVSLISAVGSMFVNFRQVLIDEAIYDNGYYHVSIENDIKNLNVLEKNRDFKSIDTFYEIGYSKLENSKNKYKPYLKLYSLNTPNNFKNYTKLIEGRYPANSFEVVVSNHIMTNGHVDLKIGDVINLNLGSRYACGIKVEDDSYLSYNYQFDEFENKICDTENIEVLETREFKIVGIIERPNYDLENYSEAGYTILTTGLVNNKTKNFITLKDPSKYSKIADYLDYSKFKVNYNNELLRWEVFKFSNSTINLLLAIVSFVILIIILTSIFCIRNSFLISTLEKTKMFGMLRSLGATKKQIRYQVFKEAFYLSLIGIPLGIFFGNLASFILVFILNKNLNAFNLKVSFTYKFSFIIAIISLLLGIITIYLSASKSAKKASRISPIDAIRNHDDIKISSKKLKTPWFVSRIFKTGGVLAYKNLKRSKKKYRTTVISIVVSIVIFLSMSTFIKYTFSYSMFYYEEKNYDIFVSLHDKDDDVVSNILSIPGITDYSLIYEINSYMEINDTNKISSFGKKIFDESGDTLKSINIVTLDNHSFKRYLKKLGLNYNTYKDKVILQDTYTYARDKKVEKKRLYTYQKGDMIEGKLVTHYYDDSKRNEKKYNLEIGYIANNNPVGLLNYQTLLILNATYYKEADLKNDSLYLNANDTSKVTQELDKLNVNYTDYKKEAEDSKSMMIIISIFLYGFITVITLIGITNIFNTITANMALRQKEFMVLKSLGMTKKEFNRMINLETIFYSFKSLFFGIFLGLISSYFVYYIFRDNYDIGFSIPYKEIVLCIVCVILLVFLIMQFMVRKINKQNIIETIRKENI